MREWKEYELQDVVEKFIDYRGKTPEKTSTGIPLVTAKVVKNGKIQPPDEFIAAENYTAWMRRGYPEINDVVMTTEAPLGEVALLKDKNVALAQRIIVFRGKQELCDNAFLKYYLQGPYGQDELQGRASGTTVEGIKASELRKIKVFLPPLPEQRAIAGVLSSLDDKIDLLHRQNKTLEGMAEALWRKMFVEEADPKWEESSLLEIIDLVGGGTPKTEISEYWNGSIPWLSARDITSNHKSFIVQTEKNITELGLKNSSAKILLRHATIISARGTVGNYCILSSPMAFSQSNYGVLPKIDGCYFFTYLLIAHIVGELKSAAYGSVFDTITTNTFREQKITLPSEDKILSFEKMINTYFEKIYSNTTQIRTLSRLRDTLLPKLMNGEVRVRL